MRKPAVKSFAGWRSITACTNTSPRRQRSADGSSRANPFPPKRSGARSGNCAATGLCSCGLSLRTYTRSMWKVMSICSGRGTESFFNNLPPAPQRAGGVISISWHTNQACNRVFRLIIYYMDRIFRVLHATGWQHITGHLRIME